MFSFRIADYVQVAMILAWVVGRNMWVLEAIGAANPGCDFIDHAQPIPQADKPDL